MLRILVSFALTVWITGTAFGQCNNVNLAAARPTSAAFGSATGTNMEPSNAFDVGGNYDQSRWGAPDGGLTHYVGIDLGQAYNICTVYIVMGTLDYATSLKIQGSNDMSTWTDLISLTNNTQSTMTIDNLPTTGTYRYVRALLLNRVYDWSYYNIYQFEIYNRVSNTPPSVDLTAPVNGASYLQGTNVTMNATAADLDGTISKVEYYQGTTKVGEAITSPYTFTWTGAAVGAYDIEAKAIDNGGASTWTDPVHITVANPPATLKNWNLSGNNISNSNIGFVSIGSFPTTLPSDTTIKLTVKGTIYAKKLTVTQSLWADYVFNPAYRLRPLQEVESFVNKHHHLPDMPSEKQVKQDGINVGDNQARLLKKIEELTLYVIKLDKEVKRLKKLTQHPASK